MTAEFKRIHKLPKRYFRHVDWVGDFVYEDTSVSLYLKEKSMERFYLREDAYIPDLSLWDGGIGRIENIRFIESKSLSK